MLSPMLILGIETSCDDTAVALLEEKNGHFKVLKSLRSSQIETHAQYGGVVPEVAAREHADTIIPLIEQVLGEKKPDLIASTTGPGLITALQVGAQAGATLALAWDVPFVGVNHIAGHVYANWLSNQNVEFPALCLIVSGGHTELILMKDHLDFELIGRTRDDAAGEAFDKVGKLLGFEYPGGPKISKAAQKGNPQAINFPRPLTSKDTHDFSFAGLKTAALYWMRDNSADKKEDISASFEQAIVDTLIAKTLRAMEEHQPKTVLIGGGVAANTKLRDALKDSVKSAELLLPPLEATTDNAEMIAVAGFFMAQKKGYTNPLEMKVDPNWRIETIR